MDMKYCYSTVLEPRIEAAMSFFVSPMREPYKAMQTQTES